MMEQRKAAGRNAPALKYDILTALMVLSCHDSGTPGRLAARLTVLMTARFNWASGSFATGQREIARLWGVTERTAKRELAAMRGLGWLKVRRASARGRVAEHEVCLSAVIDATRPFWAAVGPDFVARMGAGAEEAPQVDSNVVPFNAAVADGAPMDDGTLWAQAARHLRDTEPGLYASWLSKVVQADRHGATLTLMAPSKFIAQYVETHFMGRVLAAVSGCDQSITRIRVDAVE